MTLESIIRPGDKIDIQLSFQLEQMRTGKKVDIKTFKSSVADFLTEKNIEITMPMSEGKMVLFHTGLNCELVFYTANGVYSCIGLVKNRYKKDGLYLLDMEILSIPTKFQRREFFRVDCSLDMLYYEIDVETSELDSTQKIIAEINNGDFVSIPKKAIVNDISGGGIRFACNKKLVPGTRILIVVDLGNAAVNQKFMLVTEIIDSFEAEKAQGTYINRGKFIFKDLKDREKIVRFVFEEERRIRRKVNG